MMANHMIVSCVKQFTDYMNKEAAPVPWMLTRQANHVVRNHVIPVAPCIMQRYSIIITGSMSAHIRGRISGDVGYCIPVVCPVYDSGAGGTILQDAHTTVFAHSHLRPRRTKHSKPHTTPFSSQTSENKTQ